MMRLFASEFPNDNSDIHDGAVWVCRTPRGPTRAVLRARIPEPLPSERAASSSAPAGTSELDLSEVPERTRDSNAAGCVPERSTWSPIAGAPAPAANELTAPSVAAEPPIAEAPAPAAIEAEPPVAEAPAPPASRVEPPVAEAPPAAPILCAPPEEPAAPEAAPDPGPSAFDQLLDTLADIALARGATRLAAILPPLLYDGRIPTALCSAETRTGLASAGMASEQGSDLVLSLATAEVASAWRGVLSGGDLSACGASTLDAFCSELLAAGLGEPSAATALRRELRGRGVAAFGIIAQAA